MNNLYLFQVQDRITVSENQYWVPYSAGCIWAYAQQFDDIKTRWRLSELFFKRSPINETLQRIKDPKVCAFSVYAWNRSYTLAIAEAIKQQWPECLLIFGGPEVSAAWLRYDFADCLVLGEGEIAFTDILRLVNQGNKPESIVKTERMPSLDDVPSPYVAGVFDKLIEDNPDLTWCAAIETNRGCPYSCTFCDWGGLTQSKIKKFKLERIIEEIKWLRERKISVLYITDANFGIFKSRDVEIAKLIRTELIDKNPYLEYLSMNYEKNSNENVFKIASIFGPITKGITLSMQSMNPKTLEAIKRTNMNTNNTKQLMRLSKETGLPCYTELILGLPEETLESWKHGICELLELGQHNRIEIYPAHILENTELNLVQRSKYQMKTVAVEGALPFSNNELEIVEYVDTVCSTNTMGTDELVEAYLYAWMITNIHIAGYSKLLAKYHRYVHNIPYRKFYDNLFRKISIGGDTVIHEKFEDIKSAITGIYTVGHTGREDLRLGNLMHDAGLTLYKNLDKVLDFILENAVLVENIDAGIIEIQKRILLNDFYSLPAVVSTSVDIENWEAEDCVYKVESATLDLDLNYTNMYHKIRRDGKIYNKIEKIS